MIALLSTTDNNGRVMDGMRQPSAIDLMVLAANTGKTVVVPSGANHVKFSCTTNFYIKYTSSAITSAVYAASTMTSAGVCSSNGAELNPGLRTLTSVTGLGVIAPVAGVLTLSWFG